MLMAAMEVRDDDDGGEVCWERE